MLILAIDTTGFSASLALVRDGQEVLFHKIDPGFVPKKTWDDFVLTLPNHHQKFLLNSFKNLFRRFDWKKIDAIAVSAYSGIHNCILVGLATAETLAYCHKKPLVKVDHILAHIYSPWLEKNPNDFQFPILAFSSSGSHSNFSLLKTPKICEVIYDEVPQEVKGKVKTVIGIGKIFYQMGRELDIITPSDETIKGSLNKLIKMMSQGNPHKFEFTDYYKGALFNFDFTDFMKKISKIIKQKKNRRGELNEKLKKDMAASFQESITEILTNKILKLAEIKKVNEIYITGGISENNYLKRKLERKIKQERLSLILRYPLKKEYRLDNAAMIGALAYYQQKYNIKFVNFKPNITY